MTLKLKNRKILLGISGGIAAYKCPELVRELIRQGASVKVMMTRAAEAFVTPLTLQTLSQNPVYIDDGLKHSNHAMDHIELARWAEIVLLAPATADLIARLAHGFANDLVTTTCLATEAPLIIAPAMNQQMWQNAIVQTNLKKLQEHHIQIISPAIGEQACGEFGPGRLPEFIDLIEALGSVLFPLQNSHGKNHSFVITAGPTQEALDPVRFLTNHSSGKMGYALAAAAIATGARVTLISGPSSLTIPADVNCIRVTTANEMLTAVMQNIADATIFIGAAAVADYRPEVIASQKIKKQNQTIKLSLILNPDIIKEVAALPQKPFVVGFAAETENIIQFAQQKLFQKNLDLIIANQVCSNMGFNMDDNAVTIIRKDGVALELEKMPKSELAKRIIDYVYEFYPSSFG